MERNSRKLIKLLKQDGWVNVRTTGSHHHFKHSTKKGLVTVQHPQSDIPTKTVVEIYRQAGWRK